MLYLLLAPSLQSVTPICTKKVSGPPRRISASSLEFFLAEKEEGEISPTDPLKFNCGHERARKGFFTVDGTAALITRQMPELGQLGQGKNRIHLIFLQWAL